MKIPVEKLWVRVNVQDKINNKTKEWQKKYDNNRFVFSICPNISIWFRSSGYDCFVQMLCWIKSIPFSIIAFWVITPRMPIEGIQKHLGFSMNCSITARFDITF